MHSTEVENGLTDPCLFPVEGKWYCNYCYMGTKSFNATLSAVKKLEVSSEVLSVSDIFGSVVMNFI